MRNWNVDIISLSFGFRGHVTVVEEVIRKAVDKKVLIFAAASNSGSRDDMAFPAWKEGVICVNASSADGVPSNFNPPLDPAKNFSILGEDVESAWLATRSDGTDTSFMSGTSVAVSRHLGGSPCPARQADC